MAELGQDPECGSGSARVGLAEPDFAPRGVEIRRRPRSEPATRQFIISRSWNSSARQPVQGIGGIAGVGLEGSAGRPGPAGFAIP